MTGIHLTVAVTAHAETVVAGPTMHSAELAIRAAEAEGFPVERLIGLDAASEACRAFFTQPAFAAWKIVAVEMRDLGLTRNALAEVAKGRWIAFLDADDLFSENWLAVGAKRLGQAEQANERVIVHPEMNWFFDDLPSMLVNPAQDDLLFTPYYFYVANYYDSLCMAPRAVHLEIPYSPREIQNGFAYEDWRWNIEAAAAGWRHVLAIDTILFKRRREMSLLSEIAQRHSILWDIEPTAIDRITDLGRNTDGTRAE